VTVLPVPPPELAAYVAACSADDPVALYVEHGAALAERLVSHLPNDLELDGRRVLDFGCGSGRFLRHLIETGPGAVFEAGARAIFEACDIDAACIDWLAQHLPAPHAAFRNEAAPPLERPAGHYALIYATSVFSHLTDTWAAWVCELHRLLEDGGVLVATVIDEGGAAHFGEQPWDDARIGMLVLGPGRPWVAGGPMVLHSEWWIRAHWGRAFDVLAFHPGKGTVFGQAVVVLRKRAVQPTTDQPTADQPTAELLERLDPDEPREVSALAHALRRATEENVALNARHDEYSVAYQEEAARRVELELENAALAGALAAVRADLDAARRARSAIMTVLRALAGRARMLGRHARS
jgi:SAM-dependent methyltransferase